MDVLLEKALRIDVPERLLVTPAPGRDSAEHPPRTWQRPRWLAMAASLVLAVGVATGVWISTPGKSLASAVVDHIHHEEFALVRTSLAVPDEKLDKIAGKVGAEVHDRIGTVSYARSCFFRGKWVPHLVVQGDRGPVTVLILPHVDVEQPVAVDEDGFVGTIVPFGTGSIAIVGEPEESMEIMEQRVIRAVEWST